MEHGNAVYLPSLNDELLREADQLLKESETLKICAEKHISDGNELEWEEKKEESIEKEAYARGILYALRRLGLA